MVLFSLGVVGKTVAGVLFAKRWLPVCSLHRGERGCEALSRSGHGLCPTREKEKEGRDSGRSMAPRWPTKSLSVAASKKAEDGGGIGEAHIGGKERAST